MINSANPNCLGLSCFILEKEKEKKEHSKKGVRILPSKREEKKLFFDSTL